MDTGDRGKKDLYRFIRVTTRETEGYRFIQGYKGIHKGRQGDTGGFRGIHVFYRFIQGYRDTRDTRGKGDTG